VGCRINSPKLVKENPMHDDSTIRVVTFREGDWLVAQCLEVDIAAQAKTERDLCYELGRLLVGRLLTSEKLGVEPFENLPPAPKRYWDMFFLARSQSKTVLPFLSTADVTHPLPILELKAA
jgi:hypothetical protein